MAIQRLIEVEDQGPLKAVQELMIELWRETALDGMLAPIRRGPDAAPVPQMAFDPEELEHADPFAPVMVRNAATAAAEALTTLEGKNIALFLRPCEIRSLRALRAHEGFDTEPAMLLSSDCLAVFTRDDYERRVQGYERPLDLTRQLLQFSAQGGILPSRNQSSCQLCQNPYPEEVDLHIETIGITTDKHIVVSVHSEDLAKRFQSLMARSEPVPTAVSDRRERTLEKLSNWRKRSIAFTSAHMTDKHGSVDEVISHLVSCGDCCDRLRQYCPLFDETWLEQEPADARDRLTSWVVSCAGCGICEYDCPKGYPLYQVIAHLHRKLTAQTASH